MLLLQNYHDILGINHPLSVKSHFIIMLLVVKFTINCPVVLIQCKKVGFHYNFGDGGEGGGRSKMQDLNWYS